MQHEPSPAAGIAAALAARAEDVCRRYLPNGRRLGRYWICGDLDGARGRSLFVRLSGSGKPGGWTDAATGQHGDLLDLVRYRTNAPTLRAALDEARAFLALPVSPATESDTPYDATEAARRLWRRCRAVAGTHAERYLHARGLLQCRFAALRFHPALRFREGSTVRRFPALVAAVTGDADDENGGRIFGVQRTWLDPRRPAKAGVAVPRKALGRIHGLAVRFGIPADDAPLVVGEGIETVLSLKTAVPEIRAAAALSAGSLGAFAPPPGVARLVIARDNDEDGALAAERLARRCAGAGIAATVVVPAGNDFNDDLVEFGAAALRARFAPLFRSAGGREERGVGRADAEERIGGALAGRSGCIRATADGLWMQAVLPEAVGRFREAFPGIELRLRSAGRAEGLRLLDAGDSDLHCGGIDGRERLPGQLRGEPLPAVTLGVAAHRNHPLQAGGPTVESLADWPWVDCIADLGPEPESPSLNGLLDRLHARTGRRVASVVRAGAAGLGLMASGPYLAWLPLELLARLPGRPLSPLPLEFGRRRCPTGLVLRRSAESLAPVRALRDLVRDSACRERR